jgi:DNA-binding NtrC family response regulator
VAKVVKNIYSGSILVVDDAPDTLEVIQRNLTSHGFRVLTASGVEEALRILDQTEVDLVITDYKMPVLSGLDLINHVRENYRDTEVMMITGHASINGAVDAVKSGAQEYLTKPFTDEELFDSVSRVLDKLRLRRASQIGTEDPTSEFQGILGQSDAMQNVYRSIKKAAVTPVTVLITGESGTGKELVARAIHYMSDRASAPFVPVNCGGIPENLIESELFGHVKGSFTGATDSRAGFFLTADGGTIFLDEISETSLAMQVKLLRVIQDNEVYMVGDSRPHKANVRIIAASNKDLHSLVGKGFIREYLFFRLSVLTISIPPLRDRAGDILLLAHSFADKFAGDLDRPAVRFSDKTLRAFREYGWPGNVRELENTIQRLAIMSEDETIDVPDLPRMMRSGSLYHKTLHRPLAEVEEEHIRNVVASVGGNKTQAAEILGIDRKTLREKLKKHGLQ